MSKKIEDIGIAVLAILFIVALFVAIFGVKYAWLNYTPCSFHSVKDAPVRCLNHEQ